jgi:hypothetical protein
MNDVRDREPAELLEKTVTRGFNPIAFVLVLLVFLFTPSVAMSWESAGAEPIDRRLRPFLDVSSTGADIAVHQPGIRWAMTVRLLAIVTLIVIAAGVGSALARTARRRSRHAAIVATLSGVLLVATVLLAAERLKSGQRGFLSALFSTIPKSESAGLISEVGDAAELRAGFWLALTGLALIVALNLVVLFRRR